MDLEKLGGGFVNAILGGLILWIAQTTFHQSGQLASMDESFSGVAAQHDNLRGRLDSVMDDLSERTRSRFTGEDGDKLSGEIDRLATLLANLERRTSERVTSLQLKVIALESQGVDQRQLGRLRTDMERLQASLYPSSVSRLPPSYEEEGRYRANVARSRGSLPPMAR